MVDARAKKEKRETSSDEGMWFTHVKTRNHRVKFCLLVIAGWMGVGLAQWDHERVQNEESFRYVEACMQPHLLVQERYGTFEGGHRDVHFRPAQSGSPHFVEIAPKNADDTSADTVALTDQEIDSLYYLAMCVAYVGRMLPIDEVDPFYEEEGDFFRSLLGWEKRDSVQAKVYGPKLDWYNTTEDDIEEAWQYPFGPHYMYHEMNMIQTYNRFSLERSFAGGGNRCVYLDGFLQFLLPDLYWKLRDYAHQSWLVAREAGLFNSSDEQAMSPMQLGMRSIELLEYNPSVDSYHTQLDAHVDWDSIYTMTFALTEAGRDFDGGEFMIFNERNEDDDDEDDDEYEDVDDDEYEDYEGDSSDDDAEDEEAEEDSSDDDWEIATMIQPAKGSGILFDSLAYHAVRPIRRGRRRVLAIEFWNAGDSTTGMNRPKSRQEGLPYPALSDDIQKECILESGLFNMNCWL